MPEKTFTLMVEHVIHAQTEEQARFKLGNATSGRIRIVSVTEGSERTWEDDCADVERLDRDDNQPITEKQLFEGMGVDYGVRHRRLPHALKRDLGRRDR